MKALVVDDSLVVRTIIENALSPLECGVVHSGNGKEAMGILEEQGDSINLVLLDWNMPIQDGYETIKCIRANAVYDHICIVMISTESEDDRIEKAMNAGANGYLAKPFDEDEFIDKIRQTLNDFESR